MVLCFQGEEITALKPQLGGDGRESDFTLAPVLMFEAMMTFITRVIIVPLEPQFSIISSYSLLSSLIG